MSNEVTDSQYWDKYWGTLYDLPRYDASRGLFFSYEMLLKSYFKTLAQTGRTLRVIDCGCGEGMMLRFLKERFPRIDIAGIDFSDAIYKAERMGQQLGLSWELIKWDMNNGMASKFVQAFDVALSFGLVEHFNDPLPILRTMKSALRSGGRMITIVPNFTGLFDILWKFYDRENYEHHVPIKPVRLRELHLEIGLENVLCFRLGNPTIPNVHDAKGSWQKILRWLIMNLNGRIIQKVAPRQTRLDKWYPLAPVVVCTGTVENPNYSC